MDLKKFHWADYLICLLILVISLSIGIYYSLVGGKQHTTGEYLMGNRQMKVLPVALSLSVTYMSAVTMVGIPTDTYFFGVGYWLYIFSRILGMSLAIVLYVPMIYRLKVTSSSTYLKLRYKSNRVARLGSILQIVSLIVLNGAWLYAPAVVLGTVSDIPFWAGILITGVSATLYTTVGGYKGVIGTDVLQCTVMFVGLLAILVQVIIKCGGFAETFALYADSGRFRVNFSPFIRNDFWSVIVIGWVLDFYLFGASQSGVQRYSSMPSIEKANRALLIAMVPMTIMHSMAAMIGVAAYAYYAKLGCDPMAAGYIANPNSIMPYLMMEVLGYPGFPGFFVAACLCGALSSVSSALNGAAALFWEDLLSARYGYFTEDKKAKTLKFISLGFGVLSIAMAYLAAFVGGTLLKILFSMTSIFWVTLGLLFFLGGLLPRTNERNILTTCAVMFVLTGILAVGSNVFQTQDKPLPTLTHNCTVLPVNGTWQNHATTGVSYTYDHTVSTPTPPPDDIQWSAGMKIFHINHMWYTPLGMMIGTIISIVLSFIPGFYTIGKVDGKLLFGFVHSMTNKDKDTKEGDDHQLKTGPPCSKPLIN